MYDRKLLKRSRLSGNESYFYYTEKPKQIEHRLGVNWVYVWQTLKYRKLPDYRINFFQHEDTYENLRADALMLVQNTFKKVNIFSFVEFDIAESGNDFDKVTLYNDLYEKNEISSRAWFKLATGFPSVVIVTTGSKQRIFDRMGENRNGLEFEVYTLDEIRRECLYGGSNGKNSCKVSLGG